MKNKIALFQHVRNMTTNRGPRVSHPSDELLERYALGHSQDGDLRAEDIEVHVLTCSTCLGRLERLHSFIAALRGAICEQPDAIPEAVRSAGMAGG